MVLHRALARLIGVVLVLGSCSLPLAVAATAAAPPTRTLEVKIQGSGGVRTADGRIDCGASCTATYRAGSLVTLTAKPGAYGAFERWDAGCVGAAPICIVSLDKATTVRAIFTPKRGHVTLTVGGAGTVVSQPAGVSCTTLVGAGTSDCSATFNQAETVRLIPRAAPGSAFAGWAGVCADAPAAACEVTVTSVVHVSATFRRAVPSPGGQRLTVAGTAHVVSTPAGIDCPGSCSALFPAATFVTLRSYGLVSWDGACVGYTDCTVVVDGPLQVGAQALIPTTQAGGAFGVKVTVSQGTGGSVDGSGINCYSTGAGVCVVYLRPGTPITLTAHPAAGYHVLKWSGDCPDTKSKVCALTVRTPRVAGTLFGLNPRPRPRPHPRRR